MVILFFLLLFLYGCLVFRDYGIGVDEPVERRSSLITWLYLNPSLQDVVTDTVDFSQLEPLQEYQDRYYGVTVMLPCVIAEHLTGFTMPLDQVYAMRHFYTFALFFAGAIFFYFLCREFVRKRWLALLGTMFLVISPRILSESFYNLKDLIFLSVVIVTLYFGVRFMKRSSVRNMIGIAAAGALCVNVRIIGGYVLALCLLLAWIKAMVNWAGKDKNRVAAPEVPGQTESREKKNRSILRQTGFCLGAGLLSLGIYLLITPITWDNPVGRIIEIIRHFSDYSVWNDYNYYMGRYITREEIPWHYLPVWMAITIPAVTLICAAGGAVTETARLLKRRAGLDWERLCVLLIPVVPVAYAVFLRPTMYNGWRHFYFLYPFLCILAMFFVEYLEKKWQGWGKKGRLWGLRGVLAAGFLSSILWIGVNHPYDYVYFNEIARGWALPRFDRDYWGVSEKDALEWICDTDSREEIRIYRLTDFSLPLLAEEDRSRIVRVSTMEEAEYYVHGYHAGALGGLPAGSEGMEPCYSIDVDGYPIRTVYRREVNMYE